MLLLLSVALAQTDPDEVRARELYENGAILYEEGEYEEAIAAWEAAYALSEEPLLYYNIANAYERMGRYDEAIDALARYRAFAPTEEREALDRRLRNLETRRQEQAAATTPTPTSPVTPDTRLSVATAAPVALVGLGVVGLGTGATMGFRARGASRELSSLCVDGLCPATAQSLLVIEQRSAITADVGFAVGAIALGAGMVWLIDDTWIGLGPTGITVGGHY